MLRNFFGTFRATPCISVPFHSLIAMRLCFTQRTQALILYGIFGRSAEI